jgi:hypothetical protein
VNEKASVFLQRDSSAPRPSAAPSDRTVRAELAEECDALIARIRSQADTARALLKELEDMRKAENK